MKLILKYFGEALRKFPKLFLGSMGIVLLLTGMNALIPWGLRQYLMQMTEKDDYRVLVIGIGAFAVYLLIQIGVQICRYLALDKFGGSYMEELTLSLEKTMAETSYSEIEKQGNVIRNILYTDVLNVMCVIDHMFPSMISSVAVAVVCVGVSFFYELKVTLFILTAMFIGIFLSWLSRKHLSGNSRQTNQKMKAHDANCTQFVEMLPMVQSNDILPYYQGKTSFHVWDFIKTSMKEDASVVFWSEAVRSYHYLFTIALSAVLAIPAAGNSVPNLVFFTMIANLVLENVQSAEMYFQQMMRSHASFLHIEELRKLPKCNGNENIEKIESIAFQNVDFTYANGVSALQGISYDLKKGDRIRLLGHNGSGKSTFIKLLTGMYVPTKGQLLVNGKPLQEYSRQSLNHQILYINQDEKCLNETFKTYLEILTGKEITKERYEELIKLVELPEDERVIEGNGSSLSVGQRKKLLVMKLLLRFDEASVIILDELTAGLDVETTEKVHGLLQELFAKEGKILIMVEHLSECGLAFNKELDLSAA